MKKRDRLKEILLKQEEIREKWETTKLDKERQISKELEGKSKEKTTHTLSDRIKSGYTKTQEIEKEYKKSLTAKERWVDNYFQNFTTSKKINYEYSIIIKEIIKERGITQSEYLDRMGVSEGQYFWRLKNEVPQLKTLITFFVVFDIDIQVLVSVLLTLGVTFKLTDPIHYAYYKLVENYRGRSIEECNILLRAVGITDDEDLLPDPLNIKNAKKR